MQLGLGEFREAAVAFLQSGNQGVTHELINCDTIQFHAALERVVGDFHAVEGIDVGQLAAGVAEVFQGLQALYHLLDGERRKEIVVDKVVLVCAAPLVAPGPLAGVAYGAHAAKVHAGGKIGGLPFLYQV